MVEGVRGLCADATQLPSRRDHFEIVLCRDLLHHVNWARDAVVREALRVLRRGGILVVLEATAVPFSTGFSGPYRRPNAG